MIRRAATVAVATTALIAVGTPSASADVLGHRPPPKKCVGKVFKVGVWYQQYSGGPRGVRVKVIGPHGKTLLKKSVRAKTTWRYWRVKAKHRGAYRTVYKGGRHGKATWKARYRTRAHRC